MLGFIDSGPGHPHWNMAVDEALLEASEDRLTLRLYGWKPWGLSLGYFQPPPGAERGRAEAAGYVVTRRLTGGGAILHAHELTYALVADKPTRNRDLYGLANRAILSALSGLGVAARERGGASTEEGFLCFGRHAGFDLVFEGVKVAGSAQRQRRRRVLQHGSIVLAAPGAVAGLAATPAPLERFSLTAEALAPLLRRGFEAELGAPLPDRDLTGEESTLAERLERGKYATEGWIAGRRTEPGK